MKAPKTFLSTAAFALAALFCLLFSSSHPTAALPADVAADFEWFGTLGFPDVKGLPFVRSIAAYSSTANSERQPVWIDGFLLEDKPDQFRVRMMNFGEVSLPKSGRPDFEHRYERADLTAFAEAVLNPPKGAMPFQMEETWFTNRPLFNTRSRLFVIGWMCWRQGLNDVAVRLHAAAQNTPGHYQNFSGKGPDETKWIFRDKLDRDIGHYEMWRTVVDFGNLTVTRRELLDRLRALPKRFPHCDHLARADALAKQVEAMIAEDDAHPRRTDEEIARLPRTQQAQEWLFRLRDQNGIQMSQPGWVDIFMNRDGSETSPAHQLVKLGDDAVPALIAALDDRRLTRSVGYGRNFFFSHEVVTIGDAALKIIEHIAGHRFYQSGRIQGTAGQDGQMKEVRAVVQSWWEARQRKGPVAVLLEAVAGGGLGAAEAATKLLNEHPGEAVTAILAGAEAARSDSERSALVRLTGKLKDERAVEFLLREAREGPLAGPRAEAAWQLVKLGRLDGIAPLAVLWKESAPSSNPTDRIPRSKLIGVLALSDSPEGVRALATGLTARSAEARRQVLEAFGGRRGNLASLLGEHGPAERILKPMSPPTAAALEELLAAELEDTDAFPLGISPPNNKRVVLPRLCDEAAAILSTRWPDRYRYDTSASWPVRERQRIACLNVWRQAHGQLSVPELPPRGAIAPGDEWKVTEVVVAGRDISWPPSFSEVLRHVQGRTVDAAFFREFERVFLDACAGKAPRGDRGFCIDVFRENTTDGIAVIATPAERFGFAARPDRVWHLEHSAMLGEKTRLNAFRGDLFGKGAAPDAVEPPVGKPDKFEEMFRQLSALPAGAPFNIHMELAADRWADDFAF